jgi:hypothetical protein
MKITNSIVEFISLLGYTINLPEFYFTQLSFIPMGMLGLGVLFIF